MIKAKKTFSTKAEAHNEMYNRVVNTIGNDRATYDDSFLKLIQDGLNNSTSYNRALRRVCTVKGNDVTAIKLINIMLDYNVALDIQMTETNADGMSAMDYAQINNPVAHKLMMNRQKQDLEALARQNASSLVTPVLKNMQTLMPGVSLDIPACLTPTPETQPTVTSTQAEVFQNTFAQVGTMLNDMFISLRNNPSQIQTQAQERQFAQAMTQKIVSVAQKSKEQLYGQQNITPDPRSILERLQAIAAKDAGTTSFVALYEQEEYEQALRLATTIKNSPTMTKVFEILLDNKNVLPFQINLMRDSMERTPLHDAARAANWLAYYSMTGLGADIDQVDITGKSPVDYRRIQQGITLQNGGNLMADLLGSVYQTSDENNNRVGPKF